MRPPGRDGSAGVAGPFHPPPLDKILWVRVRVMLHQSQELQICLRFAEAPLFLGLEHNAALLSCAKDLAPQGEVLSSNLFWRGELDMPMLPYVAERTASLLPFPDGYLERSFLSTVMSLETEAAKPSEYT
jgi:hypothetical protein